MAERKSFLLYDKYATQFNKLTDEQAGVVVKAIFQYRITGVLPEVSDPACDMLLSFIIEQMDYDAEAYENTCRKRSEAGRAGGRPRKEETEETEEKPKKANAFQEKQSKAKKGDTDTDTDTDTDLLKEIERDKEKESHTKAKAFRAPSVEDVKAYATERQYAGFDAERFIAFYTSNGWKVGKNPMKDWRAAVVSWHARDKENAKALPRGKIIDTSPSVDLSFLEH